MKLNYDSSVTATTAPAHLEEQYFSIENQGMIFDILRNKMYSNPILAICREISCNARDAHREVNKFDVPIEITLPNHVDPFLKIKDYGPGISPDRISNIFIKYAASTKRNDNIQTGGFGLGAKTPFAYSDSFNIKTNYNGTHYNYVCFIDETKIGKISLLDSYPISEPNSTEIVVPVQVKDFRYFVDGVEQSTRWWNVKPIIKGVDNFSYKSYEVLLSKDNWFIINPHEWNKSVRAVVDGVEYPLPISSLRSFCGTELSIVECCKGEICLNFNVGEISLSASREQVYFDDATKAKIKSLFFLIRQEIKECLVKNINSAKNLWDANIIYSKSLNSMFDRIPEIVGDVSWNGYKLSFGFLEVKSDVLIYSKNTYSRRYSNYTSNKIIKHFRKKLSFDNNSMLVLCNLPIENIQNRHIKKVFDLNPKLNTIQLVIPSSQGEGSLDYLNNNLNFQKFEPILLSNIVTISTKKAPSKTRFHMYKYEPGAGFKNVAYSVFEQDTQNKIYCKFTKNSHNEKIIHLSDNKFMPQSLLNRLLSEYSEYSVYGVDSNNDSSKIDDAFEDVMSLQEFVDEKINDDNIDYMQVSYANSVINQKFGFDERINSVPDHEITNTNSIFLQRKNLQQKLQLISFQNKYKFEIFKLINNTEINYDQYLINHPEDNLENIINMFNEQYPLLQLIHDWRFNIKNIADYINLVDINKIKE